MLGRGTREGEQGTHSKFVTIDETKFVDAIEHAIAQSEIYRLKDNFK